MFGDTFVFNKVTWRMANKCKFCGKKIKGGDFCSGECKKLTTKFRMPKNVKKIKINNYCQKCRKRLKEPLQRLCDKCREKRRPDLKNMTVW